MKKIVVTSCPGVANELGKGNTATVISITKSPAELTISRIVTFVQRKKKRKKRGKYEIRLRKEKERNWYLLV
jgi:hypothetical protein